MFKHAISALVVSGVLLSGAAFAAEPTAPAAPIQTQAQAPAVTAPTAPAAKSAVVEKKVHKKVEKKTHEKKEGMTKSETSEKGEAAEKTKVEPTPAH